MASLLCWRTTSRAGTIIMGLALAAHAAVAAPLTWEKKGTYEACLEAAADAWVKGQAELLVNEHPDATKLDDQAVAAWTIQAVTRCKAAGEVAASTDRFSRYMAQWRQHIYDIAASIRQKGGAD